MRLPLLRNEDSDMAEAGCGHLAAQMRTRGLALPRASRQFDGAQPCAY